MHLADIGAKMVLLVVLLSSFLLTPFVMGAKQNTTSQNLGREPNHNRTEFLYDLLKGYDSRISPSYEEGVATEVICGMYVSSFDTISESTMDYVISIFLRQSWHDDRLGYRHLSNESMVTLDSSLVDKVWLPDMFFVNEKQAYFHDVTRDNKFFRLYKNGTVYFSSRLSLRLSCPMRLHKFPLDTQTCSMYLESYAYPDNMLLFKWRKDEPLETSKTLQLPRFELVHYWLSQTRRQYTTGIFSGLDVHFVLHRNIGYYMIEMYIPSGLVVSLSWVSFWINADATAARIPLGVLTVLTMTTQTASARQHLPRVSYIKAIDIWMSVCLVFVFAALLEFAIVNVYTRKEVKSAIVIRLGRQSSKASQLSKGSENELLNDKNVQLEPEMSDPHGKQKARLVDKTARRIFPLTFLAFNLVYWVTYILWMPSNAQ